VEVKGVLHVGDAAHVPAIEGDPLEVLRALLDGGIVVVLGVLFQILDTVLDKSLELLGSRHLDLGTPVLGADLVANFFVVVVL